MTTSPSLAAVPTSLRSLGSAMGRGSWGFTIVSIAAFSVWAGAGRWFYAHGGEGALYATIALVFLGLSGFLMKPLVDSTQPLKTFYQAFVPSFLAYAVIWCVAWFSAGFGKGEWLGSALGSLAFAGVASWRFGHAAAARRSAPVFFVTHSVGYFLGGILMAWMTSPSAAQLIPALTKAQWSFAGKLAWGAAYGCGFGAGLGAVFYWAQKRAPTEATT